MKYKLIIPALIVCFLGFWPLPVLAGQTLVVGDSISTGFFGDELFSGLQAGSAEVFLYAGCGSQPKHWTMSNNATLTYCGSSSTVRKSGTGSTIDITASVDSPLEQLLKAHTPGRVVIQHGDNMANGYQSAPNVVDIQNQMDEVFILLKNHNVKSENCFWITPTWGEDGSGWNKTDAEAMAIRDALKAGIQTLGYCQLVDSLSSEAVWSRTDLDTIRAGEAFTTDGLHLKTIYAQMWGEKASTYINNNSNKANGITADWQMESNLAESKFGHNVSNAGDINGDGYDDVIIGAPTYSNGEGSEGAAFIYLGTASGLSNTVSILLESNQAGAHFGESLSSAGDVNNDGYDDVIVGAYKYDNGENGEGVAFIFHGGANGLSTTANTLLESNQADAWFGSTVSSAGDVNGDGYDDVIIGASKYNQKGAAFIYQGSANGIELTPTTQLDITEVGAQFGFSVSDAGDVNGDGYYDVIVGARSYQNGESNEGAAFVYHGSPEGINTESAISWEGNQNNAEFGKSVSSAGDINGDGYDDVIVGAWTYSNGEDEEGAAFIFHGSAEGVSATANTQLESNQAMSWFGSSVSNAGDIHGDGFDDVIVGAYHYESGAIEEGAVFVYPGSASGVSDTASLHWESNYANAAFGKSVSSAGDVNGDNIADVIIGAPYYENSELNEGAVYLLNGQFLDTDGDNVPDSIDANPSSPNQAPLLSGIPPPLADEDETYTFTPAITDDGDTKTILFTITSKPAWINFDPATGTIEGTPTNDDVGIFNNIRIEVSDGYLDSFLAEFNLTVNNTNDAPQLDQSIPNQNVTVGNTVNIDISSYFSDVDVGDLLTYSALNLPGSISMSDEGVISGTVSSAGSFSVTVTVTDPGNATANGSFTFVVNPSPQSSSGGGGSLDIGFFLLFIFVFVYRSCPAVVRVSTTT